jgi:hypothetical protein
MSTKRYFIARTVGVAALLLGSALAAGCGDDNTMNNAPPDFAMMQKQPDMTMMQQQMDGGTQMGDMAEMPDADCFNNPMTHIQIINACTTSMKVAKPTNPNLPFVNGMLPPLP